MALPFAQLLGTAQGVAEMLVEEIAEQGERSAKAVESLLTRARNALRTEMERLEG